MKVASVQQMRNMDKLATEKFRIPGLLLMENAGMQVVRGICETYGDPNGRMIVICAGTGNNGGDGFVIARHLSNMGAKVEVVITGDERKISGDAKTNLTIVQAMGIRCRSVQRTEDLNQIVAVLAISDLIVDALLGTGFHGELSDIMAGMVALINAAGKPVAAVDIPSGIDGDSGQVAGACVHAGLTVTLGLLKPGLLLYPGAYFTGKVIVAGISMPSELLLSQDIQNYLIIADGISPFFPRRRSDSHKGNHGRVLIMAGSRHYTGAASLCALGCTRGGAGLVTLCVPECAHALTAAKLLETMVQPLPQTPDGTLALTAFPQLSELASGSDVLVLGPGLGRQNETLDLVRRLITTVTLPTVVDADGLYALDAETLRDRRAPLVITPHPGEMAALTGLDIAAVQANRLQVAQAFARDYGVVVILKGARTVVALPNGMTFINSTGNAGMASGGSGDVLTGLIGALLGQGLSCDQSAIAAVFLHGLAGDLVAGEKGQIGMTAGDIAGKLPYAFQQVEKSIQAG